MYTFKKINTFNCMQLCLSHIKYDDDWFIKVYKILKSFKFLYQTNRILICQFMENCRLKYGKCIKFENLTDLEQIQIFEIL